MEGEGQIVSSGDMITRSDYSTHSNKIISFEAFYGRPYYLPPFQQDIGEDDDEMTIAEHMIKTLHNKEVLRANDLPGNLFLHSKWTTKGDYMWVKHHRRKRWSEPS